MMTGAWSACKQERSSVPDPRLESWAVDGSRFVVDAGIGIWYTDLAVPDPAATTTSVVPSAKQALECDFKGLGADSGRGNWEGDAGGTR